MTPDQTRNRMFALAEQRIKLLYDDAYTRALKIAEVKKALDDAVNADFNFKAFPRAQKQLKSIMEELSINIEKVAKNGLNKAVSSGLEASMANVLAISSAKETKKMAEEATDASRLNQAFGTRLANAKRGGITLSENIWKAVSASAKELEIIIQNNIIEGKGAVVASREVRQYLNDPRRLYRRVKDKETGEYKLSKAAQQYHPGQGKYRSSYMNARRLMVSEMNMATQASECEAYASNPLIAGYEIRLSNNHTVKDPNHKGEVLPLKDICDELQGLYPPTFKFTGWHPHCYSNDSEVLTNRGWKLFKDVMATDLILSLNPHTFNVEWTSIVMREVYEHIGAMVHFYNKSLDCLVTPDHTMVYLNKADGRIKECSADKFRQAMGAFYRSSKYEAEDRQFFDFGSLHIDFDVFCEFMGYWLSDGSLILDNQVKISQMRGQGAFEQITQCVSRFAKPFRMKNDVCFGSREMNEYLKQFGTCHNKFIPYEIKNASRRQIKIFLDAFIKCDGNERPLKSFVGNRGTVCNSTKAEKIFYTTSHQLMSDICELILKAGMRPSVSTQDSGVAIKKNGTVINSNLPVFRVSICYSETSTVFGKENVDYDGLVYDLTLAKNHIMYIKRNGKCFWGSNCRCSMVPVLISPEERRKLAQARAEGKPYKPSGVVTDVPANFKNWLANNQDRIAKAKSMPFFLQDNGEMTKDGFMMNVFVANTEGNGLTETVINKLAPSEIADKRHAERTPEQVKNIQERWDEHASYVSINDSSDWINSTILGQKTYLGKRLISEQATKKVITNFSNKNADMFVGGLNNIKIEKSSGSFMVTEKSYNATTGKRAPTGIVLGITDRTFMGSNWFNPWKNTMSALSKIKQGEELTFNDEYALESLWHEIRHASAVGWDNIRNITPKKRVSMEVINQYCARRTYKHFIRALGGKATNIKNIINNGLGYHDYLKNFDLVLTKYNISEATTMRYFKNRILTTPYENIQDEIVTFLVDNGASMKDAKLYVNMLDMSNSSFKTIVK